MPEEERRKEDRRWHRRRCRKLIAAAILLALGADILMPGVLGQKPLLTGSARKRDIYVAGLFPYASHVPENVVGRGVMPSVKLAIEHVNSNPDILRNYRLQVLWNDTQCNAAVGVKAFFDMMHSSPHKVMLFGAACTQVTDPIAKASKHWRLTQLSYADTHPMFTSDSFPNFFRIVPSENAFNAPRLALLAHFNWTRVGTLYQNEPRFALAHNRLISDLDQKGVEVVESQSFATEVTTALEKLRDKDVRIILGNFNEVWAMKIFCEAHRLNMFGRRYQWVIVGMYKEYWWREPGMCAPAELQEALQGTILTDLLPLSTEHQITVSGITPDEYAVQYDRKRNEEEGYVYSRFHGYTYDGIWAMALAIQHVARRIRHFRRNETVADFRYRDNLWERLFLEALRNTSFEGVTGPVRFYDNERKAYILLKQFQSGEEMKVGEYDAINDILDLTRGTTLFWHGNSPPKDRTLHIIEQSTVNITIYAVLATAASCGIVMAAVFLAINIKYRNQRYIKMSSPHLNNLIIIGCMLTYSSVIFLGLDSQLSSVTAFPYICTARAWLLMAGFSLAFGSMFSKTWRVHSIFTDVKLNKKVIKDYQLFMVVGVLLFIDLAIMTTWQIADPFYRETKQMEPYIHPSSQDIIILPENEYCQSNRMTVYLGSIYAYKGLLMIFGAFLAWETRHVSIPALNDSKYVGMSVYNVVIMCITGAAISFVLADKQDAMFIMLSVFIIFCSTATLCLVFVPKLIELRRNPQGQIDKRFRPTLRPMSKTRRDSSVSELEDRIKDMTVSNQKFRKLLHEKENELQLYLRRLNENIMDTQYLRGLGEDDVNTRTDRLTVPRQDASIRREEPTSQRKSTKNVKGLSVTTETTDISVSMGSLTNSATNVSQPEGDYVNVSSLEQQVAKKKTSFSKTLIVSDNDRAPMTTTSHSGGALPSALKHPSGDGIKVSGDRRRARIAAAEEHKLQQKSIDYIEESHSNDESDTPRVPRRSRLPTPPPPKNVSFGELREDTYLDQQSILPPPVQFVPKHRHAGSGGTGGGRGGGGGGHHQSTVKRRSSVKSGELAHSHYELFEKRRPSVPANTISYISTENVARPEDFVIGECAHHHKRSLGFSSGGGTGYRCEKHGGGTRAHHSHAMLNGSAQTADASSSLYRRHKYHCDSHNVSSPSVASASAGYSDAERYDDLNTIQRSVSERSRGGAKSSGTRHNHPVTECPHRRRSRAECHRHGVPESKLRQQSSRMEYVQSTPDVATIHNNKFGSANPRASAAGANSGGGSSGGRDIGVATVSTANLSKMYSAVSDGELLDVAILPIFQKLLTERHKSGSRYGASVASCPNISIKCDIVEYL